MKMRKEFSIKRYQEFISTLGDNIRPQSIIKLSSPIDNHVKVVELMKDKGFSLIDSEACSFTIRDSFTLINIFKSTTRNTMWVISTFEKTIKR